MNYLEEDLQKLSAYIKEKNFENSRVLITGATGLIGSLCVKAFLKSGDNQLKGLARNSDKVKSMFPEDKNLSFVYQDIISPLSDEIECDYIVHTANSTTSKYFMTNPVEVIESIYTGTKQVLNYALKHKVKGIVYLSSMEVFGEVHTEARLSEEQLGYLDIQNIRSCYSESKRLAELLCKSYAEEYGLPVCVARLAQTFGAGIPKSENRVFAQFARSSVMGRNIVLHTNGQSMGNYCYTTYVIKALILLLKEGKKGEAYTVVNEETTRTIKEVAQMVAENFSDGCSKVIFDIPENNRYGYAPATKMKLSSKKLRELGWKPEFSLKEMFERMIPDLM